MNNWKATGFIFLGFGLVLFFVGLIYGMQASSTYKLETTLAQSLQKLYPNADSQQLSNLLSDGARATLLNALLPFATAAAACWSVAIVGVIAGNNQEKRLS